MSSPLAFEPEKPTAEYCEMTRRMDHVVQWARVDRVVARQEVFTERVSALPPSSEDRDTGVGRWAL